MSVRLSQQTAIFVFTAVRTSNLTRKENFQWQTGADTFNLPLLAPLQFDGFDRFVAFSDIYVSRWLLLVS
jgi:hypothetical protein